MNNSMSNSQQNIAPQNMNFSGNNLYASYSGPAM